MIHKQSIEGFETIEHNVDFCVIGGGIAGMFAAISAARNGVKVALVQDRPVLGGNASSEIRMWIRGAHGENNRETGILEEIALENMYRNPTMNFSIWDSILYEKVRFETNIILLLNCSCCDAVMDGNKITSILAWQTTTQSWNKVYAKLFSDCSGDSVLANLTGAEFRMGRESSEEFGEDIAPRTSDNKTMGMSCLLQARDMGKTTTYIPPKWANSYTKDDFRNKLNLKTPVSWRNCNYWWMELGGVYNSIKDTEFLRDELLKITFGVWDFIKNSGECDAETWDIEWVGFLPGKRESRRYVGDHILSQLDVRAEGKFDDLVAYGGWTMDDHHPKGMETLEPPTEWHPAPSPYGIPYRCLYSKNIDNLYFAGRNISATHSALSSTRVMATCGLLGQAVGTAASIAIKNHLSPREVYEQKIEELKQTLMHDGCFLPWNKKNCKSLMSEAKVTDRILIDGYERVTYRIDHAFEGKIDFPVVIEFPEKCYVNKLRLVFDSDINRESYSDYKWFYKDFPARCNVHMDDKPLHVPPTIVKSFDIEVDYGNGEWVILCKEENNYQRQNFIDVNEQIKQIRFVPKSTWGCEKVRLYAMECE